MMTSNPEAPLLKLLIGVIVCGAERPPLPPFLVFFWYDHQNILDYPPGCFLPSYEHIGSSCHMYMDRSHFQHFWLWGNGVTMFVSGCSRSHNSWLDLLAPLFFYKGSNSSKASCVFGIMRTFVFSLLNARSWSSSLCMKHKAIYWVVNLFFNGSSTFFCFYFFFFRAVSLMFAWTVLSSTITAVE